MLGNYYLFLSMVYYDSDDLIKAEVCAEKALDLTKKSNERGFESISKTWMGRILGKKDPSRVDKAEEYILEGIETLEELELRPYYSEGYLYLGELYSNTGHKEKALENLTKAEVNFREMGMDYWLNKTQEVLDRL
jgi:tetratricopeptide (TPR) repeat protein